jgi:hypothetical protein
MVQVKASEAVSAILNQITERAELIDDRGVLLGYFEPANEDALYRKAASLFDPEEIRKRKLAVGPGYTIEEVKERLLAQGNS